MTQKGQWMRGGVAVACAMVLAACGGGDDDGGGSKSLGPSFTSDPAKVTPVRAVAEQAYAMELDGNGQYLPSQEFYAFNSHECTQTGQKGAAVWETPNVVVYNNGTATEEQAQKIAQYAEASVLSLRDRYGITPANGLGFDGQKVRVCTGVGGNNNYSGSAGIRTQYIVAPNGGSTTGTMVFHEMVHTVQAQALNCQKDQYLWERWLTEGMALAVAGQDGVSKKQLGSLKKAFQDASGATPFGDMSQRENPRNDRYPGYRLAVETLLSETGKNDKDLYAFLKQIGDTQGCPGTDAYSQNNWQDLLQQGWKVEFDNYFGVDLRGQGVAGSDFWAAAERYLD